MVSIRKTRTVAHKSLVVKENLVTSTTGFKVLALSVNFDDSLDVCIVYNSSLCRRKSDCFNHIVFLS